MQEKERETKTEVTPYHLAKRYEENAIRVLSDQYLRARTQNRRNKIAARLKKWGVDIVGKTEHE